jgi:hypothetical protein
MTIRIETVKEAKQVAQELRFFFEAEGHRRGHAINSCGCGICVSARAMSSVATEVLRVYEAEKKQ